MIGALGYIYIYAHTYSTYFAKRSELIELTKPGTLEYTSEAHLSKLCTHFFLELS